MKSSNGLLLKELPKHLKYAFLGVERSKLVIIATDLAKDKAQKLINILKQHKEAIAYSVEDLKGINPSIYMHKILPEESATTSVEHQRRLNPVMKEVVKKEVLKWMNARFIDTISNSPRVSPVQVVPKKN